MTELERKLDIRKKRQEAGRLGGLARTPKGFAVSGKAREAALKSAETRRKKKLNET